MTPAHLAAAALLAGCISIPPFPDAPADAAPDPGGVTATYDGAGVDVTGPYYTMHFAATGFHMPDQLRVIPTDGVAIELLGNPGTSCNNEDEIGLALYPSHRIAAPSAASPTPGAALIVLAGPPVAKVLVTWGSTICPSTNVNGESTFTFFPDGRIVRWDRALNESTGGVDAMSCSCDGGSETQFIASTFTALLRAPIGNTLYRGTITTPLPASGAQDLMNLDNAGCVEVNGRQLALGWPTASGTRIRSPDPTTTAFVLDLQSHVDTVDPFDLHERTLLQLDRSPAGCGDVLTRTRAFFTSDVHQELVFAAGPSRPPATDGIYGGEAIQGNMTATGEVVGDTTALTARLGDVIPAGFGVWLQFGGPRDMITTTRGAGARIQRPHAPNHDIDTTAAMIYFDDPLGAGQSITVTAQ